VAPRSVEVLDQIDLTLHLATAACALVLLGTGPFIQYPSLSEVDPAFFTFSHGFAAIIAAIIWLGHLARVAMEWLEGRNPFGLLPNAGDFGQLLKGVAHGAGFGKEPPLRGRYNYREKVPYIFFVTLFPVMAATGYLVANPSKLSGLLGPSGLMAAVAIHSSIGLLLVLPLIWHIYFSMFEPGVLWFNGALFSGRMEFSKLYAKRPDWGREILGGFDDLKEQKSEEKPKEVTVEDLLEAGNEAARSGDHKMAAYHFLKALELYPGYSQALFNLGVVLYKSGDFRRSRLVLEKFLAQDPFGPASPKARELLDKIRVEEARK
ncbi:tetratricopeptide repeat protein, partial [bacterium]